MTMLMAEGACIESRKQVKINTGCPPYLPDTNYDRNTWSYLSGAGGYGAGFYSSFHLSRPQL